MWSKQGNIGQIFKDLNRILREYVYFQQKHSSWNLPLFLCAQHLIQKQDCHASRYTFFHPETWCCHKRKKVSICLELPAAGQMSHIPQRWLLWNNRSKDVRPVQSVGAALNTLLWGCRVDLCAHGRCRAVSALPDVLIVRFSRWKSGSLTWMCK